MAFVYLGYEHVHDGIWEVAAHGLAFAILPNTPAINNLSYERNFVLGSLREASFSRLQSTTEYNELRFSTSLYDRLRCQLLALNVLLARRPLVLERLVKAGRKHIFLPPFAPARQEDPVRILGQVVPRERRQHRLRAHV